MSDAPPPKSSESFYRVGKGSNLEKIRLAKRRQRRRRRGRRDPEDVWEDAAGRRDLSPAGRWAKVLWMSVVLVVVAAVVVIAGRKGMRGGTMQPSELVGYDRSPAAVEAFGKTFANETDPQRRLVMARDPEVVAGHMVDYPEAALTGVVKSVQLMGSGRQVAYPPRTAFFAEMDGGGARLLVVVEEEDGLRVDWDVFARYGTASWTAILTGEAAEVRVFLGADDYYNGAFSDDTAWRAFRLISPDVEQPMYAYAEVGSLRENYLTAIAAVAPRNGHRMVLRVARRGGTNGRHLFVIERLLAMGWVLGEVELEEQLEQGGEKAIEQWRPEGL